MEKQNL